MYNLDRELRDASIVRVRRVLSEFVYYNENYCGYGIYLGERTEVVELSSGSLRLSIWVDGERHDCIVREYDWHLYFSKHRLERLLEGFIDGRI